MAAASSDNTLIYVLMAAAAAYFFRDKIAASIGQQTASPDVPAGGTGQTTGQTTTTGYTAPPPVPATPPPTPTPAAAPAATADADGCVWDPSRPNNADIWIACKNAALARKNALPPPPPPPPPPPTANACLDAAGFPTVSRTYDQTVALFRSCGVTVPTTGMAGITRGPFRLLPPDMHARVLINARNKSSWTR
jgi:hypothetical protein